MTKAISVKFSSDAHKQYLALEKTVESERAKGALNSENQQLLKSINHALELLKINPVAGIQIERKKFPQELIEKYDITNLWKIDLAHYWRLMYSLHTSKVEVESFILEISDHDRYNKLFKYKKK